MLRQTNTSADNSGGAANRRESINSHPGRSPALMSAKLRPVFVRVLLKLKMSHSHTVKSKMASIQTIGMLLRFKATLPSSIANEFSFGFPSQKTGECHHAVPGRRPLPRQSARGCKRLQTTGNSRVHCPGLEAC